MTDLSDQPEVREAADGPRRVVTIGPLEAIRRHPFLALLPLVLAAAGALAYGLSRTPTHTAEARLAIGRLDLNQPGSLSSFVEASQALASGYARAISATPVTEQVARELSLPVDEVRSRLGSSPIPNSAVFRVVSLGPSENYAVKLANAGSTALQDYIETINNENPNADRLLQEYKTAVRHGVRRERRVKRLTEKVGAADANKKQGASKRQIRALERARTQAATAGLRVRTKQEAYEATQTSQSNVSLVQQLTTAATATDDRSEELQLALFYALAAGGLIGIALATLRANNRARAAARP